MTRKELLATILVASVLIAVPIGVFAYQGARDASLPSGQASSRPVVLSAPKGDAEAGQQVYGSKCASCHGQKAEGGVAPDLRAQYKLGAPFIYAWILDPTAVAFEATMPKIALSNKEMADFGEYIMALRPPAGGIVSAPAAGQEDG